MKSLYAFVALAGVLAGTSAFADMISVNFGLRMAYQDVDMSCVLLGDPGYAIMFTGTIRNGALVNAVMANQADPEIQTPLYAEELKGIVIQKDPLGDYYVTSLPLGPRLLDWILFNGSLMSADLGGCRATVPLKTLDPYGHVYEFNNETTVDYVSPLQYFKGTRVDGTPYNFKLGFYEEQTNQ